MRLSNPIVRGRDAPESDYADRFAVTLATIDEGSLDEQIATCNALTHDERADVVTRTAASVLAVLLRHRQLGGAYIDLRTLLDVLTAPPTRSQPTTEDAP